MSAPKLLTSLLFCFSLVGCGASDSEETTNTTNTNTNTNTETGTTTSIPATNPYTPYDGSCPTFVEGENTAFQSAGLNRTIQIRLPADPLGAPVVFGWHWLGGTATEIITWLGLNTMVDEGAIVIAPESSGLTYEWDYMSVSDSVDATLFDDLLWCLWEQYQVDDKRIYATGMSAGGLMTTFLIIARSEQLAAAVPFSGGLYAHAYQSPAESIPVMLVWGGPSDTYGSFSFDVASQDFSDGLQADGHFVVECEHTGGHTIPNGADDMAWLFFQDHPKSIDAEPWISALPSELPSYCALP
jgi:predicted esterase